MTKTGLLEIGRVRPQDKSLPEFVFRWDERAEDLDVDILNVSVRIRRDFERGKRGYSGHHTRRMSGDARDFETDIKIPSGIVFRGCLSVPLQRKRELADGISFEDSLKCRKISRGTE